MKKKTIQLFVIICLFVLVGCSQNNEQDEAESIIGYIVIKDNTLYIDKVELITLEDLKRMEELGLSQKNDLPNGYHIYNSEIVEETYELTDQTVYDFVDVELLFVEDEDGDRAYTTNKKDEFLKHLDEYNLNAIPLSKQKIPYFIEVKNGKVISIEEKFEYTI